MTKEDVIKALEQCCSGKSCLGCPAYVDINNSRCKAVYRLAAKYLKEANLTTRDK